MCVVTQGELGWQQSSSMPTGANPSMPTGLLAAELVKERQRVRQWRAVLTETQGHLTECQRQLHDALKARQDLEQKVLQLEKTDPAHSTTAGTPAIPATELQTKLAESLAVRDGLESQVASLENAKQQLLNQLEQGATGEGSQAAQLEAKLAESLTAQAELRLQMATLEAQCANQQPEGGEAGPVVAAGFTDRLAEALGAQLKEAALELRSVREVQRLWDLKCDREGKQLVTNWDLAHELFVEYDLDASGSINSQEELLQLTTNLLTKLKEESKPDDSPRVKVLQLICVLCVSACAASGVWLTPCASACADHSMQSAL